MERYLWLLNCKVLISIIFSVAAAVFFIVGIFGAGSGRSRETVRSGKATTSIRRVLPLVTILLLIAVWAIRYAAGLFLVNSAAGRALAGEMDITFPHAKWAGAFHSLLLALQTFSLDAQYGEYVKITREMVKTLGGSGAVQAAAGIYTTVLNVAAPVAGGAILLDIFTQAFPSLRYFFTGALFWRKRYYFSELNYESLSLAKNIIITNKHIFRGFTLIFTDAYSDDEEELQSELLNQAKTIGAICLKRDIMSLRFLPGPKKIFLVDKNENSNLETLTALLDKVKLQPKTTEIYVFSSDKKVSRLDEEVAYIINQRRQRDEEESANLPAVIPVASIRNMTYNLLMDLPLFEPIIAPIPAKGEGQGQQSKKKTLTLTILGSGVIGTEFFLTSYWCGQMLDTELHINVVSKEKQKPDDQENRADVQTFEGRINSINPDILKTSDADDPILLFGQDNDNNAERNPPYFTCTYFERDVLHESFLSDDETKPLLDSDYFIVALGSDEDNFAVADKLRREVGIHHMFGNTNGRTVISYVIYNSDLAAALNHRAKHSYRKNGTDIYMHAFGSRDSVYSVRNVMFDGVYDGAGSAAKSKNKEVTVPDRNAELFDDIYRYRADLARRVHRRYKEYSAGLQKESVFTYIEKDGQSYADYLKQVAKDYIAYAFGEYKPKLPDQEEPRSKKDGALEDLHRLAWLEHRRWVAFMRINGFRLPPIDDKSDPEETGFKKYVEFNGAEHHWGDHKFISLKLHPCLVECAPGMNALFDDCGSVIVEHESPGTNEPYDRLDALSHDIIQTKTATKGEDFKRWDYPANERFDPCELEHVPYAKKRLEIWKQLEAESGKKNEREKEKRIYRINGIYCISADYYQKLFSRPPLGLPHRHFIFTDKVINNDGVIEEREFDLVMVTCPLPDKTDES